MKKVLIVVLILVLILATSITASAFAGRTPAEIVASLTGKTTEEVVDLRYESGKTYGQMAYEVNEDAWKEFREEMLQNKKAILKERVDEGILTQEEADEIISNMEEMQDYCLENGGGFGMMRNKSGNGFRMGNGNGMGNGFKNNGNGMGFGGGRCGSGSW